MTFVDLAARAAEGVLWFLSGVGCTVLLYRARGYHLTRRNGRHGSSCQ